MFDASPTLHSELGAWLIASSHRKKLLRQDDAHHLLERIAWSVRPEELARVRKIGVEAYLDEQLHPEQIPDDAVAEQLRLIPILEMDRGTAYSLDEPEYRCYKALVKGMVLRAVYSQRQLLERMVEFWSDHFNIPADEYGPDLLHFQREVIRKHALGNFRDLLHGTARSAAMLYYLDNYVNFAEHPNENYARELLELHTLGVDGGYSETDVKEVARAFTGWTVSNATDTGFYFDAAEHDEGAKQVLGHSLPAGRGIEDGLHVLHIAANHPSTTQYICQKLCVRFISDTPPPGIVDSTAAVWRSSGGNIKAVIRHILLSEEFRASQGQKFRRPLDFFIGALQITGTKVPYFYQMEDMLMRLAQLPYGWHPPDGYPDSTAAWLNTNGLMARWNVAAALTHAAFSEPYSGMETRLLERIGNPQNVADLVDVVSEQVYGLHLPDELRDEYIAYASDGKGHETPVDPHVLARKLATLYSLMLASPLYQWH